MGIPINFQFPPIAAKTVDELQKDAPKSDAVSPLYTQLGEYDLHNVHNDMRGAIGIVTEREATAQSWRLQMEQQLERRRREFDLLVGTVAHDATRQDRNTLDREAQVALLASRVTDYTRSMPTASRRQVVHIADQSIISDRAAAERNARAVRETMGASSDAPTRIEDRRNAIAAPSSNISVQQFRNAIEAPNTNVHVQRLVEANEAIRAEARATTARLHAATEALHTANAERGTSDAELRTLNAELRTANAELEAATVRLEEISAQVTAVSSRVMARRPQTRAGAVRALRPAISMNTAAAAPNQRRARPADEETRARMSRGPPPGSIRWNTAASDFRRAGPTVRTTNVDNALTEARTRARELTDEASHRALIIAESFRDIQSAEPTAERNAALLGMIESIDRMQEELAGLLDIQL